MEDSEDSWKQIRELKESCSITNSKYYTMKKAVTAGQIADWFAIGTQSAKQNAEKEMRESGTEANAR